MRRWEHVCVLALVSSGCGEAVPVRSALESEPLVQSLPSRSPTRDKRSRHAPLAAWRLTPDAATLSGLEFGMSFERAWDAHPKLRAAMRVSLDADEFDDLSRRRPELAQELAPPIGAPLDKPASRRGTWPVVDGPQWELRFERAGGLSGVWARFASEEALRSATASWGPPDIAARWQVWTDEETRTQAAFTGCEHESYLNGQPIGELHCFLEWRPLQSAREVVQTLFPNGRPWIGAPRSELSLGAGFPGRGLTRFSLRPLPADLWMPLEVQFDEGERVSAYRTALPHTYDPSARQRNMQALREVLPLPDRSDECSELEVDGHRVSVCHQRSELVITVGVWR